MPNISETGVMPNIVTPLKRGAVAALLLAALAGCNTANLLAGGSSAYDGIWAGRILFTYGLENCPKRGAIRAEIRGGNLDAELRWQDGIGDMDGTIAEDGRLMGSDMSRKGFNFAEAEGRFEERTAKGTYEGKKCRGTWELQKVRNL